MKYQIGQTVQALVLVTDENILDFDRRDFETVLREENCRVAEFVIIGLKEPETYILWVQDRALAAWTIEDNHLEDYGIASEYLGKEGWRVEEKLLREVSGAKQPVMNAGQSCVCCREWFVWAGANQSDGQFACWSCRHDPRNMLEA
jgi:hypothetical protein